MVQIISEASNKPIEEVRAIADHIYSVIGSKTKIDDHVPDDQAEKLLTKLRKNLPGVRRWLVEGYLDVITDSVDTRGTTH